MTWRGHWRLESLVRERTRAKAAARHVLLEIAIHARSDTDETDVSTRELERWTGHDRKTVTAAVKELVRLDELEVSEGGHGRRNSYRVKIERLEQLPGKSLWGGAQIPPHGGAQIPPLSSRAARTYSTTGGGKVHHSNGKIPPLVGESSNTERAPKESQRVRENREIDSADAESQHRAVALVDVNIDRPGTTEVREMARAALARLVDTNNLRPTLAALGWDEERDGKVTAWLAVQNHAKLREVISKAHDALAQTARETRHAGGQ